MSARQLKKFQKILFLLLGIIAFGRKNVDILPILNHPRPPAEKQVGTHRG